MSDVDSHCSVASQSEFVLINFSGSDWIHLLCREVNGKGWLEEDTEKMNVTLCFSTQRG